MFDEWEGEIGTGEEWALKRRVATNRIVSLFFLSG